MINYLVLLADTRLGWKSMHFGIRFIVESLPLGNVEAFEDDRPNFKNKRNKNLVRFCIFENQPLENCVTMNRTCSW